MIYWSIYPLEFVMDGYDDPRRQPALQEMQIHGLTMVVEPIGAGRVKVHRLVSPNAADYLDPRFAPGAIVDLAVPALR